jgi:hypothetical protein
MSLPVSAVEVVCCRIIVVDSQLHQAQAKHTCVKIDILRRITSNRSHAMYAENVWHLASSPVLDCADSGRKFVAQEGSPVFPSTGTNGMSALDLAGLHRRLGL